MKYPRVLTIAGSDSGGGAGIQADIKTISAHRCYAASVITAVTAQNTLGVTAIHPIPATVVEQQISAVLSDIGADAIKIGMLSSVEIIETVSRQLALYNINNVVLDPVMVSTSGHRLVAEDAIEAMVTKLMPRALVVTPNIPEVEVLLGGIDLSRQQDLPEAARALANRINAAAPADRGYKTSVLLKAGHLVDDQLVDVLFDAETTLMHLLPSSRIDTRNTHGTGCTLSSAVASNLALGLTLPKAVVAAKRYIDDAIRAGAAYEIGGGHGPVCHFYNLW